MHMAKEHETSHRYLLLGFFSQMATTFFNIRIIFQLNFYGKNTLDIKTI